MSILPKIRNNIAELNDEAAITQVEVTASAFEKDPTMMERWPADVTTPAAAKVIAGQLREAGNEARKGGSDRIEHRKAIRAELNLGFAMVVQQIEVMASKNPQIITTVGLQQHKPRSTGSDPVAPVVKLSHGIHPGLILVSAHRLDGASVYEVQYTYGDPLVEENWIHACSLPRSTHIPVDNLQQAQRCYFRMRGIWASGNGPWSAVMSIIVL